MITLVLLASGYARRFGSNKLFYEIDGKAMYLHILERLHCLAGKEIDGHILRPLVVTQYQEIMEAARQRGMEAVFNDEAAEGISASVRLGAASAGDSQWIAFFTADQPFLELETIEGFLKAAVHSQKPLASVCHGQKPGSPTLFHRSYFKFLLDLRGDRGGRVIQKQYPQEVFWYEISGREIMDIDFRDV